MNCRPSAAALIVLLGLVPTVQKAIAGTPTYRQATATATILSAGTNDASGAPRPNVGLQHVHTPTLRFMAPDGSLVRVKIPSARRLIIIDLP
jgi:hypothetical protein